MLQALLTLLNPYVSAMLSGSALISWYYWKHRGVPPGPIGLPLLGYAPFFGAHPQEKFLALKEKYGKIFSMSMGPNLAIVLNDYETIKAAFVDQGDIFLGRPDSFVFKYMSSVGTGKVHGMGLLEGADWRNTRRFTLQAFRDLGMGKSAIQDRILEEAECVSDVFAERDGKPFDPSKSLTSATSNVIVSLCFGRRFEHDDPKFRYILDRMQEFSIFLLQSGPLQAYPKLRFLPGAMSAMWARFVQIFGNIQQFLQEQVQDLKDKYVYDEDLKSRSFVGHFVSKQEVMKKAGEKTSDTIFSDEDLLVNVQGFFGAGTETTATTLLWAFLFMMHHPVVQQKIHDEIDDRIGREHPITVNDRVKLTYLEAVIREVQRLGNVIPFGVMRSNTEETTLMGYRIPKRSLIMPNYLSVNMDAKLWPNPSDFRPERFLNSKGELEEPPYFMPFATGKRSCVGESLARMEIFLFFANIMQKFRLRPAAGYLLPSLDQNITGISCRPLPYQMDVQKRT